MLEGRPDNATGSIVACVMEGTRPILIEIQALISKTTLPTPRRTCVWIDYNRLNLLMGSNWKKLNISLANFDAYVNVIGGMKINETAIDLPIVWQYFQAIIISHSEIMLLLLVRLVCWEVRAVPYAMQRILEAKIGFNSIILPEANKTKINDINDTKLIGISEIQKIVRK